MNTRMISSRLIFACLLVAPTLIPARIQAQTCETPAFQPVTGNGVIEWNKFPDFSLPFKVIFGGPRGNDASQTPLRKGFSHLANFSGTDGTQLPAQNRAILWYGTATGLGQPWETIESPWANNMNAYRNKWAENLRSFAALFSDSQGKAFPNADMLMVDIERHYNTNDSILSLKRRNLVPAPYSALPDAAFLTRYQRDMQNLYAAPLKYMRDNGLPASVKLTSYADVPIRNTFVNVDGNSWQDWTTNPDRVHYLTKDTVTNNVGGSLYNYQDFLLPSAYYLYDTPSPFAGNYLSYLLFQVEANKAWSKKDIIPIVWLRYTSTLNGVPIRNWMAEATAIFPFFSGAKGIWVWESPVHFNPTDNLAMYEYFIQGLYRLSQFKDFFDGGTIYIPKSARDHFADRDPIWRGVVKGNRILIAAHAPFASDNQTTTLTARYGTWQQTLTLKGHETLLCAFDIPETANNVLTLKPYPNPGRGNLTAEVFSSAARQARLQVVSLSGQVLLDTSVQLAAGVTNLPLSAYSLPAGLVVVRISDGTTHASSRLLIR
jgi:hypothetical protein